MLIFSQVIAKVEAKLRNQYGNGLRTNKHITYAVYGVEITLLPIKDPINRLDRPHLIKLTYRETGYAQCSEKEQLTPINETPIEIKRFNLSNYGDSAELALVSLISVHIMTLLETRYQMISTSQGSLEACNKCYKQLKCLSLAGSSELGIITIEYPPHNPNF